MLSKDLFKEKQLLPVPILHKRRFPPTTWISQNRDQQTCPEKGQTEYFWCCGPCGLCRNHAALQRLLRAARGPAYRNGAAVFQ